MRKKSHSSYVAPARSSEQRALEDHRVVPCEACGTEGRIYVADMIYDRNAGGTIPDQRDIGPCDVCEGTGGEIIMTEPIELEDLPEPESDYLKYRGKCKELAEAAIAADPLLTLVRGHYLCPWWGEQPHWWAKKPDGSIVDPSKDQFPSKGAGQYVEFDGFVECSNCGKRMREDEGDYHSNYVFCSYACYGQFVL